MTWIAISDHEHHRFSGGGLGGSGSAPDRLMPRGSLVIETRLPDARRPRQLLLYKSDGSWPLHLSLQALPGGGITLVLDQGGEILHRTINLADTGRTDILRITYSWDAPNRWGRFALERTEQEQACLVPVVSPRPLRADDILSIVRSPSGARYVAPEVLYLALSDCIEPVGPMPSLAPDTPVATPQGYREISQLRRGDTVLTPSGEVVPVLHVLSRTVPAMGSFRPVRLRAPYFGLQQDVTVAPAQRLVLSGSEVEYLFGRESVLVPVCHLVGGTAAHSAPSGALTTYWQLLLPGHEPLLAAGTEVESLYIGRLRRKRDRMDASVLAGLDRAGLPEHGRSLHPVLKPFDAVFLAEQRAA